MRKLINLWLMAALVCGLSLTSCKDDDNDDAPTGQVTTGATMSLTVVFAPGQLGDMGFADNVLEGVYRLKVLDHQAQPDTLDVHYVTGEDLESTIELAQQWLEDPYNRFSGQLYKRRLLVLTEPFMVDWIEPMKEQMRPEDEVLVLKVNAADVAQAAGRLGMGERLHGLNISAAWSARRFCKLIESVIEEDAEDHENDIDLDDDEDTETDDSYVALNASKMSFYRLYDPKLVGYRDSIYQVLRETYGYECEIVTTTVADAVGNGIFSNNGQTTVLQEAYKFGHSMFEMVNESGYAFHVADLGSAAQGLNYYFLGNTDSKLKVLMLDTELLNQYWIRRDFGMALYNWGAQWMRSPEVGTMPAIQEFGAWNSEYVTDNLDTDFDFND